MHSSENLQEQSDLCDNNVLFSIAKFILRNVGDSGVGKVTSDMLLEVLGVRIGSVHVHILLTSFVDLWLILGTQSRDTHNATVPVNATGRVYPINVF